MGAVTETGPALIFDVLRYTTLRRRIRSPDGKKVRFAADYSNHTVNRRQTMDTARERGVEFFLLYPATLKVKDGAGYRVFNNLRDAEDFLNSRSTMTQERSQLALDTEAVSWHTRANTSQAAAENP